MTRVHDTARWISYILFLAQLYFVSKNAGWRILRRNILNCSWESTLRYSIPRCWPFRHFFSELWSFAKFDRKIFSLLKVAFEVATSVTRLGDLLDFGQLLKAFGSNYFAQISHILGQVKPPLSYFYRQLAIFSGHTGGDLDRTSKAQIMFQHFLKKGLSRPLFSLFSSFQHRCSIKVCRWQDSNLGSLVWEATALPTEPQPLPILTFFPTAFIKHWK